MNAQADGTSKNILKFWRWARHWQILLGLILGAGIGFWVGFDAVAENKGGEAGDAVKEVESGNAYLIFKIFGDVFLNGLQLVVIPLVVSSIVLAVASIGKQGGFGRLGMKTMVYYMSTSIIAILIGLGMVNWIEPGVAVDDTGVRRGILMSDDGVGTVLESETFKTNFKEDAAELKSKSDGKDAVSLLNIFRMIVPQNFFVAGFEQNLLGLIFLAMCVGYFMTRLEDTVGAAMAQFWEGVYGISIMFTDLVLRFAPIGVGMLIAGTVSFYYAKLVPNKNFDDFIDGVLLFSLVTVVALAVHMFIVMPLILGFIAKVNPIKHYRAMLPALLTAFSTASSAATLPVTMACVEEGSGVSKRMASFVLPLGATVNMDGAALYECVAALFICQSLGVDLSFSQQFFVVVVALVTSIGVAGIPSSSLVAIVLILGSIEAQLAVDGIQVGLVAALPILLIFDRLLDMCRTAVNIFTDSCGAVLIAKSEGEDVLTG